MLLLRRPDGRNTATHNVFLAWSGRRGRWIEHAVVPDVEALLEFDLAWDVAGYDSTGERAALILIETGRSAPALMYISIPNTHAELYGIVDRVIGELDVLT